MSNPINAPGSEYAKKVSAKATVGEAYQLANTASVPAFIAARFALWVAVLAFVVAAIALAVAVSK